VRGWSIGAAVFVHAAALLCLPERRPTPSVALEGAAEIDIEPEIVPPQPSVEPAGTNTAPSGGTGGIVASVSVGHGPAREPGPAAPPASSGSAEPATTAQIFAMSPADLGIGGTNPFLPRRDDAEGVDHENKKNVLRDSLRARDMALGLGPQGPVVEALRDAAYSSTAPANGKAIFEIHAGEGGVISLVDLVTTEGGGWSDTQRVAKEKLASVKLVLPRGSKGAVLRVEVTSKWSLPNGQRSNESGWGTRSAAETGNGSPAILFPDVSNLGAKPRRVVSAHVVGGSIF
jgi:hypothetical protein